MGVSGVVGTYETDYGGEANRIHNVQLVAHLVDGTLIAPGATFSFNGTTGDRSAAKGFLEAPVIINGELQTGLGGGVCQVSTTVFNAAYEAGLRITDRTNHALYISHYPLGRDATVDYPDIDLKFVNDTPHWLLLRTFVGSTSLTVTLFGTPQHRRIVTDAAPLTTDAAPPLQRVRTPDLPVGQKEVVDYGVPASSTSVRRLVYAPNGDLLSDETWHSYYQSQPKIVEIGSRKPKAKNPKTQTTTTGTTTTSSSTTTESTTTTEVDDTSAAAIASASQSGTRVGRSETASTVACAVQPSAMDRVPSLDDVLEAEPGAPEVAAAGAHAEPVVEACRLAVPHVRLEDERFDPQLTQVLVAAPCDAPGSRRVRPRTRSRSGRDHDRHGGGEAERARTRDDEHGHGVHDRVRQTRVRAPGQPRREGWPGRRRRRTGTKYAATTSATRWMFARLRCASPTIRTICASIVSRPTLSATTSTEPVRLRVPATNAIAGALVHRERLAGDHRLVDGRRPLRDASVPRARAPRAAGGGDAPPRSRRWRRPPRSRPRGAAAPSSAAGQAGRGWRRSCARARAARAPGPAAPAS